MIGMWSLTFRNIIPVCRKYLFIMSLTRILYNKNKSSLKINNKYESSLKKTNILKALRPENDYQLEDH